MPSAPPCPSPRASFIRAIPKILWSAFLWLVYLGLLVARWRFAQSGRRFAVGVIGTFAFLVLTFWGINLFSPLHHQ